MELDDILKKSFATPTFEYKEEHWKAANVMIDKYYRDRLRMRITLVSALVLLLLVLIYFFYDYTRTGLLWQSPIEVNKSMPLANNHSVQTDTDKESPKLSEEIEVSLSESNNEVSKQNSNYRTDNNDRLFGESTDLNRGGLLRLGQNNGDEESKEIGTLSNSTEKNLARSARLFDEKGADTSFGSEEDLFLVSTAPGILEKNQLAENPIPATTAEEFLQDIRDTELAEISSLLGPVWRQEALVALPHVEELESAGSQHSIAQNWKKTRLFAGAEVMTFPGMLADANRLVGASLGLGFNWYFYPSWFLETGLGFSVRSGNFDPSIRSTQYTQYFGPRFDSYVFRPSELFNINIPLALGFQFERSQITIGYRLNYLVGVYGGMEYAKQNIDLETQSPSYSYESLNKGWLSKNGLRDFMGAFTLNYRYEFTPRIHAGLRLHFLPNDWIGEDFGQFYDIQSMRYVSPDVPVNGLKEKNWILGFSFIYYL